MTTPRLSLATASYTSSVSDEDRPCSEYHSQHGLLPIARLKSLVAMAEIFGAVASGAGLVSLSMQLLESTQKLKGFYDTSKDAPDTVARLCFDLETMSLALRQFEQYRQNDVFGGELLARCILACDTAVARIQAAVDKVERLLKKSSFIGRVYMGFKEPEVRVLLEEMEYAKSSMSLAYQHYCQYASPIDVDSDHN